MYTRAEFDEMLLSNAEFLRPFATTLTHDSEDAKDLFQETIFKALANRAKYNMGTNVKAWLYTIMRNIFINNYRRKSKFQVVTDNTFNDFFLNNKALTVLNGALVNMNVKHIQKAITELPEIFRKPFVLYIEGFKYHEIADFLSEPLGTIKSRIHFARKLLKAQIERF